MNSKKDYYNHVVITEDDFKVHYANVKIIDGIGYTQRKNIMVLKDFVETTNRHGDTCFKFIESVIMLDKILPEEAKEALENHDTSDFLHKEAIKYKAIYAGEKYAEGVALYDGDYDRLAELLSNSIRTPLGVKAVVAETNNGGRCIEFIAI